MSVTARLALVGVCVVLGACTTPRKLTLQYAPSDSGIVAETSAASMSMGVVTDRRDDPGSPLGTAIIGAGSSKKELYTTQPPTAVVRDFFTDALRNREAYDPNSPDQVTVDIMAFEVNQFIRREVYIDLLVSLKDANSGYTRTVVPVRIDRMQGGLLNAGNLVMGNYEALQNFVDKVLSEAADKGVDQLSPR